MKETASLLRLALLLGLAAILPGCASIEREWTSSRSPSQDPFAGRWEGKWSSEKEPGEGGRLRCVFTAVDPKHYRAVFEAHWKIFQTSYTAVLDAEKHGSELRFQGTHRLPAIYGGLYRYHGTVTPDRFFANYDSSYDRGAFEMTRPKQ